MESELDKHKSVIRDQNKKVAQLKMTIAQHQGRVDVLTGNISIWPGSSKLAKFIIIFYITIYNVKKCKGLSQLEVTVYRHIHFFLVNEH